MSKVRIVQCLCPQRHCITAIAYLSETGEADPEKVEAVRAVTEHMMSERLADPWCGICGAREFFYEDAPTVFATMEEASGPLAEQAARQAATREFLRRSKN